MKTIKIGNSNQPFEVNRSDTTYLLEAAKTVDSHYTGIEIAEPPLRNVELIVNGTILSESTGIYTGVAAAPVRSLAISVGKEGEIDSLGRGIDVDGRNVEIENRGSIAGTEGVRLWGHDGVVENSGLIEGANVGIVAADGTRVFNSGTITGDIYGIVFNAPEGAGSILKNSGTVEGGTRAVFGSDGGDRIVNSGMIAGDVLLRDGDDVMVFKGGTITGTIYGGVGDDLYVVKSLGPVIKEAAGEGEDTVRSSISWTIGDNIETLQLTGKKNLNGFGSAIANNVTGNAGENWLYGRDGDDTMRGGAGNDMLTGDQGSDTFVFMKGAGRDTIMDFEAGIDAIELGGLKGAKDFADMLADHVEQGDDLWIVYGKDAIVLKDTTEAELQAGDFVF